MSRTLFKYEPFRFVVQTAFPIAKVTTTTNLIPYVTRVDPSAVIIGAPSGYIGAPSSNESVVIDTSGGPSYSNLFVLNAGRFFDSNSNSLTNTFSFYKNEAITPILFDSCINLATIQTVPSLPPGLSFESNTPHSYLLKGTPTVQTPTSNYLVIGTGTNLAQVVTTRIPGGTTSGLNIGVNGERVQVNISGTPIISPMIVDAPISTRVITSIVPSPSNASIQYSWGQLPSGIQFSNKDGTPYYGTSASIPGGFDPSFTLVLNGTPTLATAKSFASANIVTYTVPVQSFRTSPLPNLSNAVSFSFRFPPMVLFDDFTLPQFYNNAPVNPNQYSFRAKTYFTTDTSITSITQTGFPSGFDVSFVSNQQRAYLTGTPTVTGTFSGTLFASDTLGNIGSNPITITVANDAVTFQPPTSVSGGRFIVSRPLTSFKDGYYTSNIQFYATADSLCNVTYSVSGLGNTGIETNVSNGILTLTGIPSTAVGATTLTVTATSTTTSVSASTSVPFEVVNDVITFNPIPSGSTDFIQNREIKPIQLSATTLSERFVQRYFSDNLPQGLLLSPNGILSGTPTGTGNGTFTVIASTGLVSQSNTYSYSIEPDNVIALLDPVGALIYPNQSITPTNVKLISKSGGAVQNIAIQQLDPSYGIVFTSTGSNTGILSGTFTDGTLATAPLISNVIFQASGNINQFSGTTPLTIQTQNADVFRRYLVRNFDYYGGGFTANFYIYSQDNTDQTILKQVFSDYILDPFNLDYYLPAEIGITDFQIKYPKLSSYQTSSNTILCTRNKYFLVRSLDGITFNNVGLTGTDDDNRRIYQLAYTGSGNTWLGIGYRIVIGNTDYSLGSIRVYRTSDDGSSWSTVYEFPYTQMAATFAYIRSGGANYVGKTCIRMKNNIALAGGSRANGTASYSLMRSTDTGVTWSGVTGQFNSETQVINIEGNVWLIGGSDVYEFENGSSVFSATSSTIRYSVDQGLTWNSTNGDFNFACVDIVYGEGQWIAYGMSYQNGDYQLQFKYSSDGINWFPLNGVASPTTGRRQFTTLPLTYTDKVMFDGANWDIYVLLPFGSPLSTIPTSYIRAFRHARLGSLSSDWTEFVTPNMDYLSWTQLTGNQIKNIIGPPGGGYFVSSPGAKLSALAYLPGKSSFYDPKL